MSIGDEGFLSEELEQFRVRIHTQYAVHFELVKRVNGFCQKTKFRLLSNSSEEQKLFACCVTIKLLSDTQAAVLLIERGMLAQTRILLRTALEALFILVNGCERKEFLEAYFIQGQSERLKLMNAISRSKAPGLDEIRPRITPELIKQAKEEIEQTDVQPERIEELAKQAKLDVLYDAPYRFFSLDVHTSARSLDKYINTDDDGRLQSFAWGPVTDNLQPELAAVVLTMIACMTYLDRLFNLQIADQLERFQEELLQLG